MEIRKLKKQLLREELKRRRKSSKNRRLAIRYSLLLLLLVLAGVFFYLNHRDRVLQEDYDRGMSRMEQGKYEKAATGLFSLYKRHAASPLAPRALFQSAEIDDLYLKKPREALLAYLLVEKDYPNSPLSCRAQGRVAEIYKYRLMEYGRAIVAYQNLLDSGCAEGDGAQNEMADAYFRLNNFEQARIEFENLVKRYPKSPLVPEAKYRIGVAYSLDGHPDKAEAAFRRMFREYPKSPFALEARFSLASVLEGQHQLKRSLKILKDLKGVYPDAGVLSKKIRQIRELIRKKEGR